MKKLALLVVCAVIVTVSVNAQAPAVNSGGVVNAASYALTGLPNSSIAQGSIFLVFGANLGPAQIAYASFPLPTTVPASNGTSIKVTSGGTTVNAFMVYSVAGQVAAILPSSTPTGTGTLTVTYNGQTSNPVPITVVANTFGVFSTNQQGNGPGVVTNGASPPQPSNATNAANPGEVNIIWGTGLGPISGADNVAPGANNMPNLPVQVWIGGVQATVQYQGRSPCCAGLDQINFVVPAGVTGCNVPVYVVVGNTPTSTTVSNFVTMSIAVSGRICSDPVNGLTTNDIQNGVNSGFVRFGIINLERLSFSLSFGGTTFSNNQDSGSAMFAKISLNNFLFGNVGFNPSVAGSCIVSQFQGSSASFGGSATTTPLDAGASIGLTGPGGAKTLAKQSTGNYNATFSTSGTGYLSAGTYTATGPGGADVGAFTATTIIPQPLTWKEQATLTTIVRSSGQTVSWTGGDPNSYVFILGESAIPSPQVGVTFVCIAPVSAGQFRIPASVLLNLPATVNASQNPGILAVGSTTTPTAFTATGLDHATISSTVLNGTTLTYQ